MPPFYFINKHSCKLGDDDGCTSGQIWTSTSSLWIAFFNPEQHYIFEPRHSRDFGCHADQVQYLQYWFNSRRIGQLKNITVKYVDLTLCESFVLPPATDIVIVDHVCASSSLLHFFKIIINSILIVTILEFDQNESSSTSYTK